MIEIEKPNMTVIEMSEDGRYGSLYGNHLNVVMV